MDDRVTGECFLVILRRIGAQAIFRTSVDYRIYLKILRHQKRLFAVKIYGYRLVRQAIALVFEAKDTQVAAQFLEKTNMSFERFLVISSAHRGSVYLGRCRMIAIPDYEDLPFYIDSVEAREWYSSDVAPSQGSDDYSSRERRLQGIDDGLIDHLVVHQG